MLRLLLLASLLLSACAENITQVLEDKPDNDLSIQGIVLTRDMLYPTIENSIESYGTEQAMIILKNTSSTNYYSVVFQGEIEGYSFTDYSQKYLNPHSAETLYVSPLLDKEKTKLLKGSVSAPLHLSLKVTSEVDDTSTLFKNSSTITIASRNSALLELEDETEFTFYNFLASWICPNSEYVNDILKEASSGDTVLIGYLEGTDDASLRMQVEKIYNALSEEGITYVNDNFSTTGSQNVRFPIDVQNDKMANCVDGVILYASILESLGFRVVIAITSNHSYLGWKNGKNEVTFLETTVNWGDEPSTFTQAVSIGNTNYQTHKDLPDFRLLDLEQCRKEGILPFLP